MNRLNDGAEIEQNKGIQIPNGKIYNVHYPDGTIKNIRKNIVVQQVLD
jgi:hypothetical protein